MSVLQQTIKWNVTPGLFRRCRNDTLMSRVISSHAFCFLRKCHGENVSGDVVQRGWDVYTAITAALHHQEEERHHHDKNTDNAAFHCKLQYMIDWQTTQLLLLNRNIRWHVQFYVSCCWTCLMFGCWQSCRLASFRSQAPISTEVYPVACSAQALLFSSSVWDSNWVLPECMCSPRDVSSQEGTMSWQVLFACLVTSEKL